MILEKIRNANGVCFACENLNADKFGASLALYHCFSGTKKCSLFCANEIPKNLLFLNGAEKFKKQIHSSVDLVIAFGAKHLQDLGIEFKRQPQTKYVFLDNEILQDLSGFCEFVFWQLKKSEIFINKPACKSLYTGLFFSTNGFENITRSCVFEMAKDLVEKQIDTKLITKNLKQSLSLKFLRVLGEALKTFELHKNAKIIMTNIKKTDLEEIEEAFEIANYLLRFIRCEISAVLVEDPNNTEVILMSKEKDLLKMFEAQKIKGSKIKAKFVAKDLEEAKKMLKELDV